MSLDKLAPAAAPTAAGSAAGAKEKFSAVLKGTPAFAETAPLQVRPDVPPSPLRPSAPGTAARAHARCAEVTGARPVAAASRVESPSAAPPTDAVRVLDRVTGAQHRLDSLLKLAESGKNFTPGELLAMQAHVYRASQELDLAGKVVEKATAGVKQILQTQL